MSAETPLNLYAPDPRGWSQRLLSRIFPEKPFPALPGDAGPFVLRTEAIVYLSWSGRLRLLLTGCLVVKVQTLTDVEISKASSESTSSVIVRRRGARAALALLAAFLALPAFAQDPRQEIPPPAPVAVADTPAGAAQEPPKPKLWKATFHAGESNLSTPESLTPYVTAGVSIEGEPWPKWTVFGLGTLDRMPNGNAWSIEGFSRDFAAIEGAAGFRYRLPGSLHMVSVGAIGAVTWSRESDIKSPADPRLYTVEGIACLEKWDWFPAGGLACVGVGLRGPVGGGAASAYLSYPIRGGVALVVEGDLPFRRLPEFVRALPAAAQSLPLQEGPPTPEQIVGVAQKLPIRLKVGIRVPLKAFEW